MDWPYQKPVFVLSNSMKSIPEAYRDKAQLVNGSLEEVLGSIHEQGYYSLYIDGGRTIQSFLEEDLVDEMTITIIPYLLGDGIPLFSSLPVRLEFKCVASKIYLDRLVQNHFARKR
jgi:dihydrofolate reductase